MDKLTGMLGLCARAGKLVSGRVPCEISLSKKRAKLLLVESDCALDTQAAWRIAAERVGTPLIFSSWLGEAVGKPGRVVVAVEDAAFAANILKLIEKT